MAKKLNVSQLSQYLKLSTVFVLFVGINEAIMTVRAMMLEAMWLSISIHYLIAAHEQGINPKESK